MFSASWLQSARLRLSPARLGSGRNAAATQPRQSLFTGGPETPAGLGPTQETGAGAL